MSNPRSAGNAWAKLKNKLMSGDDTASAPATPKKGGAKKKTAVKDADGDEVMATPKKTPRKRAAKKQDVDGEASPKKKVAGKKALSDESRFCYSCATIQRLCWHSCQVRARGGRGYREE